MHIHRWWHTYMDRVFARICKGCGERQYNQGSGWRSHHS